MTQDELKQSVAREAIKYIVDDEVIGVGSGSTANFFIDELGKVKNRISGAVASSEKTAERLKKHGIRLFDLNAVNELPVYIDGADEITEHLAMIKGGGGALTREKIVAAVAKKFVCIADESKLVPVLGKFPLPVEVIQMARGYVARQMVKLGGQPKLREGFSTDNGNIVLDVWGLSILNPVELETTHQQHRRCSYQRTLRTSWGECTASRNEIRSEDTDREMNGRLRLSVRFRRLKAARLSRRSQGFSGGTYPDATSAPGPKKCFSICSARYFRAFESARFSRFSLISMVWCLIQPCQASLETFS